MPIIEIEMITDEAPPPDLAEILADRIGDALGAAVGSTWVRLRALPRSRYGESGGPLSEAVRPVFVTVTAHSRPRGDAAERAAKMVVAAVAESTDHPRENVHVIFAPDAAGRIAFGGELRS